jgi:hypothetical protein
VKPAGANYCWLILLLTPFLVGGVVVGDEALLLHMAHGLDSSALSFRDFARSLDGWYIPHHLLWFGLIYVSAKLATLLHLAPLITEAMISSQTVLAGLASIALCYTFLVRRRGFSAPASAWAVLAFFAGGYGVFIFCMAGSVESYLTLLMAARLFYAEAELDKHAVVRLAILDVLLVALKIYILGFLVFAWPLLRAGRQERWRYVLIFAPSLLALVAAKLWLWNPVYMAVATNADLGQAGFRFAQEFFSPWTGLIFCLPAVLLLLWHAPQQRCGILFKGAGIAACAAFFSLYDFFNGDIAGGRYIFPLMVALLPEIATGGQRLLARAPKAAWLLPLAVLAFMPVAGLSYPFFSGDRIRDTGRCTPDHPVVSSWKILIAKAAHQPEVEICFHSKRYFFSAQDVASPHLGPWRIAYILEGGHSADYRALAHDEGQRRHDAWGEQLSARLRAYGVGDPLFWEAMGLIPALVLLSLSIWAAIALNRFPPPAGTR